MINAFYAMLIFEGLYLLVTFNRLIRLRQSVRESWHDVTVQLSRRNDALEEAMPIVEAGKDYEAEVTNVLVSIRENMKTDYAVSAASQDAAKLQAAVARMLAVIENNPELKASQAYIDLMRNLHLMENDLQAARIIFNQAALRYNKFVNELPSSLVAKAFGYSDAVYFKAPPTA